MSDPGSIEQLRTSFWYGNRSNLNFKFLKDLSDDEFGDFVEELLGAVSETVDDGDSERVIETAYKWQLHAYAGHLGDPADFPHRHEDISLATLDKPLSDARVALVTSSGHFLNGDDPEPFGVKDMTQREAESRIGDFLREAPELSAIPFDADPSELRVRHGGYPVQAVAADHQVALPLDHMRTLVDEGFIGEVVPDAFSFVGAASQLRLQRGVAPAWAERLKDLETDAVLLVPV